MGGVKAQNIPGIGAPGDVICRNIPVVRDLPGQAQRPYRVIRSQNFGSSGRDSRGGYRCGRIKGKAVGGFE